MSEPELLQRAEIEVRTFEHLSHRDLVPLLDVFERRVFVVRSTYIAFEPPAAGGGPDVALAIMLMLGGVGVAAGKALFGAFCSKLGERMADALFNEDNPRGLSLFNQAKRSSSGRHYASLSITYGRVRFYFEGDLTREEWVEQLHSAATYFEGLPESALEGGPGPSEYGLHYDKAAGTWRGAIRGIHEEFH